jgi:hypothetical protein
MLPFENAEVTVPIKEHIRKVLPTIEKILNPEIQNKTVEAWGKCLVMNGFHSIDQLPPREIIGKSIGEAAYTNAIASIASATADMLNSSEGFDYRIVTDTLIAGALCHGMGRAYTCNLENVAKWKEHPAVAGYPSFQYQMYSAYIAKRVALPEDVVHCCWTHPYPATGYGNSKWKRSFNSNLLCTVINGFVKHNVYGNIMDNTLFASAEEE